MGSYFCQLCLWQARCLKWMSNLVKKRYEKPNDTQKCIFKYILQVLSKHHISRDADLIITTILLLDLHQGYTCQISYIWSCQNILNVINTINPSCLLFSCNTDLTALTHLSVVADFLSFNQQTKHFSYHPHTEWRWPISIIAIFLLGLLGNCDEFSIVTGQSKLA